MPKLKRQRSQSPVVPSPNAKVALSEAYLRIHHPQAAQLLWERVLTPGERKRLHGELPAAYHECGGTVGIWCTLRSGCNENAVIEINHKLGLMSDTTREWLRREFGLSGAAATPERHLEWNNETGELRLNDKVIRTVRRGVATNVDVVLDAFQEEGWPQRIDDPLPNCDVNSSQRLRGTVRSLNDGLEQIRFAADGSGEGVMWKTMDTK